MDSTLGHSIVDQRHDYYSLFLTSDVAPLVPDSTVSAMRLHHMTLVQNSLLSHAATGTK